MGCPSVLAQALERAFPYSRHSGALGPRSIGGCLPSLADLVGQSQPYGLFFTLGRRDVFHHSSLRAFPRRLCCGRKVQQSRLFFCQKKLKFGQTLDQARGPSPRFLHVAGATAQQRAVILSNLMLTRSVPGDALSQSVEPVHRAKVFVIPQSVDK